MYSWEISQILEQNNYSITADVYNAICKSIQVSRVKYEPFEDYFEVLTNDNYYWKFTVVKERKGNEN